MDGLSCNNCGTPMHESDIFCRRCGAKRQLIGMESEACFCPQCGNSLRSGARFCDMCGEEFPTTEGGDVRPRGERSRRRRKGCIRKLLLLILLLGIAGAVVKHRHSIQPILEELAARHFGGHQTAVVSEDIISSEPLPADPREVTYEYDERDEEDSSDPAPDAAPEEENAPLVIAIPVTEEPAGVSPDLSVSPDLTISPDSSVSPATDAEEPSGTAEVVWTERDQDGYSFLSPGDGIVPDNEVLSLQGVVSGNNVRVRNMPSTARGRILRELRSGVSVDVTRRYESGEERYYWFQVRAAGEIGWIYGEFLQVESTNSEVEGIITPLDE